MGVIFLEKNVMSIVDGSEAKPEANLVIERQHWIKRDNQAINYNFLWIS